MTHKRHENRAPIQGQASLTPAQRQDNIDDLNPPPRAANGEPTEWGEARRLRFINENGIQSFVMTAPRSEVLREVLRLRGQLQRAQRIFDTASAVRDNAIGWDDAWRFGDSLIDLDDALGESSTPPTAGTPEARDAAIAQVNDAYLSARVAELELVILHYEDLLDESGLQWRTSKAGDE